MKRSVVFLNSARLDFDNRLDFTAFNDIADLTLYQDSKNEEILSRITNKDIIITKELSIGKHLIEQFQHQFS